MAAADHDSTEDPPPVGQEQTTPRATTRSAVRLAIARLVARWRNPSTLAAAAGLSAGATLLGIGFALSARATVDCPALQMAAQLAASNSRLDQIVESCRVPRVDRTGMLVGDLVLIAGYWLVGTITIVAGWWRYDASLLRRLSPIVVWLPSAAAVLDLIEDIDLYLFLGENLHYHHAWQATATFFVAWSKWIAILLTVGAGIMSATVWWSRRANPVLDEAHTSRGVLSQTVAAQGAQRYSPPGPKNDDLDDPRYRAIDNPPDWADPQMLQLRGRTGPTVGICISGGGIRSAAFGLGVLTALEAPGSAAARGVASEESVTEKARYLAAVSGGAWAATAWAMQSATSAEQQGDTVPAANSVADQVVSQLSENAGIKDFPRQQYLLNGRGSLLGLVSWALCCSFLNLLLIGLLVFIVAWPLGYAMGFPAVRPDLRPDLHNFTMTPDRTAAFTVAGIYAIIGIGILLVCGWARKEIAGRWTAGVIFVFLAIFTAGYFVWLPDLFLAISKSPDTIALSQRAAKTTVAGSVFASFVTALWRIIKGQVVTRANRIAAQLLPKFIGFLVLLGCVAWAGLVMFYACRRSLPSAGLVYGAAVIAVLLLYIFLNPNYPTLHNVYAARLTATFDPANWNLPPSGKRHKRNMSWSGKPKPGQTWEYLAKVSKSEANDNGDAIPELVLCCAQQRNGIARGGLRAKSFTISPHWVRFGSRSLSRRRYEEVTDALGKFRPKFSNIYSDLKHVTPWLATTGAAFSSAMGRQSLGSANALLATINADLGVWMPSPVVVQDQWRKWWADTNPDDANGFTAADAQQAFGQSLEGASPQVFTPAGNERAAHAVSAVATPDDRDVAHRDSGPAAGVWRKLLPRPRFSYILKEILGWYSTHDRYIFVTDGGHWENLGLVELLRLKCNTIYCIDASGDPVGTFATLRQAFDLASLELGQFAPEIDFDEILRPMKESAAGAPAQIATSFRLPGVKPEDSVVFHYTKLQATQRMPDNLRRLAVADPMFPHYSTARQLLTATQFEGLYELGQFAGGELVKTARSFVPGSQPRT